MLTDGRGTEAGVWRRCVPWLVAGLVVLGAVVRLRQYLACFSYWYDEAYLLVNVTSTSFAGLVGPLRCNLVIPPAFLWLLRLLYLLLGADEWVMRLPAVLFSLAALFVMIPLARRVIPGPFAWLAVALGALAHHAVVHACEVRPYTADLLVTELTLLASAGCLLLSPGERGHTAARVLLLPVAVVGPWLSFPAVFVLGATSLALAGAAWRRGGRSAWLFWVGFNGLVGLSAVALWWFQARHLYYPGLKDHWVGWGGFPEDAAPLTVLRWTGRCLVGVAHYAATGLGVPLLLLGVGGAVALWRRSRGLVVLVAGPVVLGYAAALLRVYPLADRTTLFAAPCLWLLAAAALASLARLANGRLACASLAAAAVLVVPLVFREGKYLVVAEPRCDFRGALAHVRRHEADGDLCWVSHPEVYEVYRGDDTPCLGSYTPPRQVAIRARGKRLWVVTTVAPQGRNSLPDALPAALDSVGLTPAGRESFAGVDVVLYEPASARRR